MEKISLESKLLVVKSIKKRTSAEMLKDVKEGHVLRVSLTFDGPGRSYRGTYATNVLIQNLTTNQSARKSLAIASRTIYDSFVLEEWEGESLEVSG